MRKKSKREIDPAIGLQIRRCRESFHYSREHFAELTDISTTFLAEVELGSRTCSYMTLAKICKVLGVTSDFILFGDENVQSTSTILALLRGLDPQYFVLVEIGLRTLISTVDIMKKDEVKDK